ncbi:hypothetical protein E4U58_001717, partial [Claviceps cyperi]
MRQGADEPLFAYHTRVVGLLRRAGGKDTPSGDDTPLSVSEKYILNDFVRRFVQGLADKSLVQEAITQNVLAADSLKSAYERIRQASSIQLAKTELARAVAQETKISLMEEYIRQSSGCSANEELSRAYRLPHGLIDVWGGTGSHSLHVDALMAQLQPSMSHLGIQARWSDSHAAEPAFDLAAGDTANLHQLRNTTPRERQVATESESNADAIECSCDDSIRLGEDAPDDGQCCGLAAGTQYVGPPVRTRYVAVVAELESSADADDVKRPRDDSQLVEYRGLHEGKTGIRATVGEVVDGQVTLRPIPKSPDKVDEDIVEILEAVPASGKRQGMSITKVCGDDETSLPRAVPLFGEKTVKRSIPALSEIWRCEGIGPVVLKGLVAFLMQPWMINRELPTQ